MHSPLSKQKIKSVRDENQGHFVEGHHTSGLPTGSSLNVIQRRQTLNHPARAPAQTFPSGRNREAELGPLPGMDRFSSGE
jgi:hypothetical protein